MDRGIISSNMVLQQTALSVLSISVVHDGLKGIHCHASWDRKVPILEPENWGKQTWSPRSSVAFRPLKTLANPCTLGQSKIEQKTCRTISSNQWQLKHTSCLGPSERKKQSRGLKIILRIIFQIILSESWGFSNLCNR